MEKALWEAAPTGAFAGLATLVTLVASLRRRARSRVVSSRSSLPACAPPADGTRKNGAGLGLKAPEVRIRAVLARFVAEAMRATEKREKVWRASMTCFADRVSAVNLAVKECTKQKNLAVKKSREHEAAWKREKAEILMQASRGRKLRIRLEEEALRNQAFSSELAKVAEEKQAAESKLRTAETKAAIFEGELARVKEQLDRTMDEFLNAQKLLEEKTSELKEIQIQLQASPLQSKISNPQAESPKPKQHEESESLEVQLGRLQLKLEKAEAQLRKKNSLNVKSVSRDNEHKQRKKSGELIRENQVELGTIATILTALAFSG